MKTTLQLETLTCPSCLQKIEGSLKRKDGIEDIRVMFNASRVKVEHDENLVSKDELKEAIEAVGYEVLKVR